MNALELPAFLPLGVTAIALTFKMAATAIFTAATRNKVKVTVNPEDAVQFKIGAAAAEAPEVARAKRAHLNDLENILPFLALAIIFALAGGSAQAAWITFGIFTVARFSHTLCYVNELQPWRTASFFVGLLAEVALMVQIGMKLM